MRLKARFILCAFILFIFYVSFKILEPELKGSGKDADSSVKVGRNGQGHPPKEQPNQGHLQPAGVKGNNETTVALIEWFLSRYQLDWNYELKTSPWKLAASWVRPRAVHPDHAPELGGILREMYEAEITKADVCTGGTQLKLCLTLKGGQAVLFKPQWYSRDYVVVGSPYAGRDRHNGEIAAFTLNRILGFRRTPLVVGRVIDLTKEIKPVATKRLLDTFFTKDENVCFYGKCLYCKGPQDGVCAEGNRLEGAVVLFLPAIWSLQLSRYPWARTYRAKKKAAWETYDDYCTAVRTIPQYRTGPRLLDILDASVFDYLIGNADRHQMETFRDVNNSMLILLDSGKSFGNPRWDEKSILAPIYQCCSLRRSTWERLQLLRNGVLSTVMKELLTYEPTSPVLSDVHYEAMDRRLEFVLDILEDCIQKHSTDKVLVRDNSSAS